MDERQVMIDIIHDCDPGNDDAVGILVALGDPDLNLLAVTTGAGHLASDRTARNAAITMAAAAPVSAPVAAGSTGPLIRERMIARWLDMTSGLDAERNDLEAVELDVMHSVDRLAEELRLHPGLTVVATGPLTNLALLIRRYPVEAASIGRIITLGGAWGLGTKTAAAEWNILCDPEAAAIVYGAGIPLTMVPTDSSGLVPIDDNLIGALKALPGPAAALAAELLQSLTTTFHPGILGPDKPPLFDPCAIVFAADPGIAKTVPARVDIDTTHGLNYGRTVVDFAGRAGQASNCDVVIEFDIAATQRRLVDAIAALSRVQTLG
jgi:inosine-uridine nucleoside N-ribohydrolase